MQLYWFDEDEKSNSSYFYFSYMCPYKIQSQFKQIALAQVQQ